MYPRNQPRVDLGSYKKTPAQGHRGMRGKTDRRVKERDLSWKETSPVGRAGGRVRPGRSEWVSARQSVRPSVRPSTISAPTFHPSAWGTLTGMGCIVIVNTMESSFRGAREVKGSFSAPPDRPFEMMCTYCVRKNRGHQRRKKKPLLLRSDHLAKACTKKSSECVS